MTNHDIPTDRSLVPTLQGRNNETSPLSSVMEETRAGKISNQEARQHHRHRGEVYKKQKKAWHNHVSRAEEVRLRHREYAFQNDH